MELLIFYVLLALGVSFLCSILEAVLLSTTAGFVQHEESSGKKYAKHLAKMKDKVDTPLSAILTLNTIAHTMGAAGAGAQWIAMGNDASEAAFAAVLTFLVLVFSEIIPKTIGARYWRVLASPSTALLRGMIWFLTYLPPVLPILRLLTKLLGGHGEKSSISRAELAAMAQVSSQSGELEDEESQILQNLFMFKSSKVRDIMTPRTVVYALRQNTPVEKFLTEALPRPFSRVPIFDQDRDHITGFVLKSDIMRAKLTGDVADKCLSDFLRPINAVSGDATVYHAFKTMTQENQHLILVIDGFGGMEGIVTMEDVVETLLGMEIVDEADRNEDMQVLARSLWVQRAKKMGIDIENTLESAVDQEPKT